MDFFFLFFFIVFIIFSFLSMSFFTLMEQKLMGSAQLREGPYYSGFLGILQPFCDAVKLYSKFNKIMFVLHNFMFNLLPYVLLFLFNFLWLLSPILSMSFDMNLGVFFFLLVLSISMIIILMVSWFSNCKYSMLGGLRSVSQMISYDVCLGFIFLCMCFLTKSLNLLSFGEYNGFLFMPFMPIFFIWLFTMLAESNRTPFDFVEGESELVSGFNTEYSGGPFALCFMSEYISMLFMSFMSFFLFFFYNFFLGMSSIFFCFVYIMVRCFLPRYRYDKLMFFCWKALLPFLIVFLVCLSGFF